MDTYVVRVWIDGRTYGRPPATYRVQALDGADARRWGMEVFGLDECGKAVVTAEVC